MLMTYRDGSTGEDDLFDQPEDVQRAYIAQCMNLDPGARNTWPMSDINNMLALRRLYGRKKFYKELGRMLQQS